jgi:hypothetical protein
MAARVSLLFTILSTSLLHCKLYHRPVITLCSLGRFNRMATDIDSLAPIMDGHRLTLGIGRKGLRKTWQFF